MWLHGSKVPSRSGLHTLIISQLASNLLVKKQFCRVSCDVLVGLELISKPDS